MLQLFRSTGVPAQRLLWSTAVRPCPKGPQPSQSTRPLSPALRKEQIRLQVALIAMARQNLRLVLSDVREAAFEGFGDASVQCASRLAQKATVSRILDQRVLKEITRMGRYTLAEQQPDQNDPIQSWPQLLLARACVMTEPAERE